MLMVDSCERENEDEVMTRFQMEKSLNSVGIHDGISDGLGKGCAAHAMGFPRDLADLQTLRSGKDTCWCTCEVLLLASPCHLMALSAENRTACYGVRNNL